MIGTLLQNFSSAFSKWTGTTTAFTLAVGAVVAWACTGPYFHYSDTWQLIINTTSSIVTFLMVFMIQRAQNKDALAIHLKLNEIVAALKGANNRLIDVEALSEDDLKHLHERYQTLARRVGGSIGAIQTNACADLPQAPAVRPQA